MNYYKNYLGETFYYSSVKNDGFFEVNLCGETPPNIDYEMFRYNNFVYVFEYVISGKGYINSDNKCYTVSAGDFYYMKKGFTGHYFADADTPYSKIWVNVRGTLVEQEARAFGMTSDIVVYRCTDNRIKNNILSIRRIMINTPPQKIDEAYRRCSIKLIDIMSIVRNGSDIDRGVVVESDSERIYQYLETHVYEPVTLSEISEKLHMHETTVIRIFRDKYGVTPMKYLNNLRINAAKKMLRDNFPPKDVASMLRYSDISYFSLAFKKATGMAPNQYRKYSRSQD